MFFPIPPTETQEADDAQFYRHHLHIMIELGTEVATVLRDEITRRDPQDRRPGTVEDFERVNRGTRRAILLARKIAEDRRMGETRQETHQPTPTHPKAEPAQTPEHPQTADTPAPERLDRLDRPEFDDNPARRPIPELIAEIAKDLHPRRADKRSVIRHPQTEPRLQEHPFPLPPDTAPSVGDEARTLSQDAPGAIRHPRTRTHTPAGQPAPPLGKAATDARRRARAAQDRSLDRHHTRACDTS